MKIIFSPSKEMRNRDIISLPSSPIFFKEENSELLKMLQSFSKEEIAEIMKIKGKLLEETFENIRNFDSLKEISAFSLYNGVSFKNLELEKYDKSNVEYAENTLLILSAFYGVLHPSDSVKNYRLDMTMKLSSSSLYSFWNREVTDYISCLLKNDSDKTLINLASGEYSKMIERKSFPYKIIDIDFKENKNGKFQSVSSFAKQGRGSMLNYLIKNRINDTEKIKEFSELGYSINNEFSDKDKFIFTR
ncbi:YaaA family protein [Fusobacterium ulcerans]|uniref:YaaA family protein n=1 Tax=Fusobacterium ulcerans TaxID=861 RepID=UPI002E78C75E|nr:YaaA family protein [Fusobacterium ulcerans]MEE0137099.1 YaaA family protein [Fusobacterium ulcerans]